ncbi:MAG: TAXI family TRAP transporter solute-binding subunit [Planctomycetota bacterium]
MRSGKALITIAVAVLVIGAIIWASWPDGEWPKQLHIATATPGGTYYSLGEELAQILEELPDELGDVRAVETAGSKHNIKLLAQGEAELAFVADPALREATRGERDRIRILAYLYLDVVQVVVNKKAGVTRLADLRGKGVYIGNKNGATRIIATKILRHADIGEGDFSDAGDMSYRLAGDRLAEGTLDAAFFLAGTPTDVVRDALISGECNLLSLKDDHLDEALESLAKSKEVYIPTGAYRGQGAPVTTVGTPVFLIGRADLPSDLVVQILDALFDNISSVIQRRSQIEDIKLQESFPELELGTLQYHPGVDRFVRGEKRKLLIATGPIGLRYYDLGKTIRDFLEQEGIPTRVLHTDGSLENLELLERSVEKSIQAMAILQYDVALAAYMGNTRAVYGKSVRDACDFKSLKWMSGIAALHPEKVYVVAHEKASARGTVADLEGLRVCLGPKHSGTRVLAEAILKNYGLCDKVVRITLPVRVMRRQLQTGKIDAGFYVSGTPSKEVERLIRDPRYRLLRIEPDQVRALLQTGALQEATIPAKDWSGKSEVSTVSTRAVLVTTKGLRNVEKITRAIFFWHNSLQMKERDLAERLPLPLHEDAEKVYRDLGYLPKHPEMTLLEFTAHVLAILVVVFATCRGSLLLRREWVSNRIKGEILTVALDKTEAAPAQALAAIRRGIRDRALRKWWQLGELDKSRWAHLDDMIESRINDAQAKRTKALLHEARALADQDEPSRSRRAAALRQEIWRYAEEGELQDMQTAVLLKALDEIPSAAGSGDQDPD